ncbi:alpha-mannosidase 2-like isoform X2 [Sycon ciliatum]|uniref:alpha-mannosidase 2-like isoform X2 n=1 Tax=Sycon ciliatum TaxID=27933 RepID=UPI0031F6F912
MKRWVAIVGPAIFLFSCAWMYLMMEVRDPDRPTTTMKPYLAQLNTVIESIDKDFKELEKEKNDLARQLTHAMAKNPKLAAMVKETTRPLEQSISHDQQQQQQQQQQGAPTGVGAVDDAVKKREVAMPALSRPTFKFVQPVASGDVCSVTNAMPSKTGIKMDEFLEKEDFADIDGGVWKQGFELSYSMSDFDKEPLHVFVVPHSHNDPGWLKTVEGYYEAQTRSILNNIVNFLSEKSDRKFIWAEMSYLSMWWNEQGDNMKEKFRKLVRNKQLEIVTGGWVMNDEANTHYFAMIDQMIEGHEWIRHNVGENIIPSSGWAIDPFGHSPTMAYILKRMKFDFMLIQRTHYIVKKQFARQKSLEFSWKQTWDSTQGNTDMLTHMMPFYSYDVPHTCGPDPKVCCQFDFRRLAGGKLTCPWRINPVPINDGNVEARAEMLLDQYRKKSRLFRTNVLLIPLGDDFRYDLVMDAQNQFNNYEALMTYINNTPRLKAKVQFGTLSDYYNELIKRAGKDASGLPKDFPSVGGDFFTYTDRNDDYWSGYFTSRPFYKNLDRVLETTLRASELLFSVSHALVAQTSGKVEFDSGAAFSDLVQARRTVGLFQHHDGITGTARMEVVVDYGKKLINAYHGLMGMMRNAVSAFLQAKAAVKVTLSETSARPAHDSLETLTVIDMASAPRLVTIYNPLARARTSVVRLLVNDRNIEVVNSDLKPVPFQLSPSWQTADEPDKINFEILIKVFALPLGVTSLLLRKTSTAASLASTTLLSSTKSNPEFNVNAGSASAFSVENSQYKLDFDTKGMLKSIFTKSSQTTTNVALKFLVYGTVIRPGHKPGAYLFFPAGPAEPHGHDVNPVVRVVRGSLCNTVSVHWPQITHHLSIYNIDGLESFGIDIENIVDITQHNQKEFIMRLETDVKPTDAVYYTDLNGFTMQKRKYNGKLPTQGNFYPLPAMAFLEDSRQRLSLASAQPLGSSSLQPGWLEVVLDRRLMQDDDRGLGQPVTDNKPTKSSFRLLLEQKPAAAEETAGSAHATLMANMLLELFMHHPISYVSSSPYTDPTVPAPLSGIAQAGLPCNLFMVNLRTLQKEGGSGLPQPGSHRALLVHNKGFDCRYAVPDFCMTTNSQVNLGALFEGLHLRSVQNVSLSLAHRHNDVSPFTPVSIRPLEIEAYNLEL